MLKRAENIIPFFFPRDHGKHDSFQTEWWYLSGRLESSDGGSWAYHFTIFRRAFSSWSHLALIALAMGSKSIREFSYFKKVFAGILENSGFRRIPVDGYVGHFSLTNIADREFVFFERGGTSLLRVAGATDSGLHAWVKSWRLFEEDGAICLKADRKDFGIDLRMTAQKPPVLNGNMGLSRKSTGPGEASYHYSLTSLKTAGNIKWKGKWHEALGTSFMDREFGTSILPRSIRGWDWFGIVLNNNCEFVLSLIRKLDGTMASTSSGTVVNPDGSWSCFDACDIHVKTMESWKSGITGATYPVHWLIKLQKLQMELEVKALIDEHELVTATSTTVNYWEGPVDAHGSISGHPISGHGHVELVGYSESAGGKF